MTSIIQKNDACHHCDNVPKVVLYFANRGEGMIFSKSFGYALRGVLYVTLLQDECRKIQVEEMAEKLSVPKYFMSKILKKLVKHGVLTSVKGPKGGFSVNSNTAATTLITIRNITDGSDDFTCCALYLHECDNDNPCPLHQYIQNIKANLLEVLTNTTVSHLLISDKPHFIESITTIADFVAKVKHTASVNRK